jgi:hypothetical protein
MLRAPAACSFRAAACPAAAASHSRLPGLHSIISKRDLRCSASADAGDGSGGAAPAAAAAGPPPGADRPLDHKVALITGANTGIGFQTAKALLRRDYQVVLACRDKAKAEAARAKLRHAAAALLSALRDPASSSTSTPVLYLCMSV